MHNIPKILGQRDSLLVPQRLFWAVFIALSVVQVIRASAHYSPIYGGDEYAYMISGYYRDFLGFLWGRDPMLQKLTNPLYLLFISTFKDLVPGRIRGNAAARRSSVLRLRRRKRPLCFTPVRMACRCRMCFGTWPLAIFCVLGGSHAGHFALVPWQRRLLADRACYRGTRSVLQSWRVYVSAWHSC